MIFITLYILPMLFLHTKGHESNNTPLLSPPTNRNTTLAPPKGQLDSQNFRSSSLVVLSDDENSTKGSDHLQSNSNSVDYSECGLNRFDTNAMRIIGGEEASLGEFPWIARIGWHKFNGLQFDCGGSLVSTHHVISAAHCGITDACVVRLGEHNVKTNPDCDQFEICAPIYQDIGITKVVDPGYCPDDALNDIVLVTLKAPAHYNEFVRPICLPTEPLSFPDFERQTVSVSGWGLTTVSPPTRADRLMYVNLHLLPLSNCSVLYTNRIDEDQLCLGFEKGKDSCNADSGGPASMRVKKDGTRKTVLVGLVSYGLVNCGDGPAVYTNVSSYLAWISEEMGKR